MGLAWSAHQQCSYPGARTWGLSPLGLVNVAQSRTPLVGAPGDPSSPSLCRGGIHCRAQCGAVGAGSHLGDSGDSGVLCTHRQPTRPRRLTLPPSGARPGVAVTSL